MYTVAGWRELLEQQDYRIETKIGRQNIDSRRPNPCTEVESPAEFIMSYAPRKYNSIQTHIKGTINLVNLRDSEETAGYST